MPKVRALVPLADPKTGEAIAAGAEVDVDDETYRDWKADGKVSALDDEKAAEERARQEGNFDARTGRSDVEGGPPEEHPQGGPPGQTGEHPLGGPPGQTGEHPQGGPPGQDDEDDEPDKEPRSRRKS
jgi:hypothetical protein